MKAAVTVSDLFNFSFILKLTKINKNFGKMFANRRQDDETHITFWNIDTSPLSML